MRLFPVVIGVRILLPTLLAALLSSASVAQSSNQPAPGAIPDAPTAVRPQQEKDGESTKDSGYQTPPDSALAQEDRQDPGLEGKQTKRILGIVPNFRSVSAMG